MKKVALTVSILLVLSLFVYFLVTYLSIKPMIDILESKGFKKSDDYYLKDNWTFRIYNKDEYELFSDYNVDSIEKDVELFNSIQDKFDLNKYKDIINSIIEKKETSSININTVDYTLSITVDFDSNVNIYYKISKTILKEYDGGLSIRHKLDDKDITFDLDIYDKLFDRNISKYTNVFSRKIDDLFSTERNTSVSFVNDDVDYYTYFRIDENYYYVYYSTRPKDKAISVNYYSDRPKNNESIDVDITNIKDIYELDLSKYKEEMIKVIENGKSEILVHDEASINITINDEKTYYIYINIK